MKVLQLLIPVAVGVLCASLAAEESDPAVKCDLSHNACIEKCDQAADGSTTCYDRCEEAYTKCLAVAQGEEPEPVLAEEPQPQPAAEPEQEQAEEQEQEPAQGQVQEQKEEHVPETGQQ